MRTGPLARNTELSGLSISTRVNVADRAICLPCLSGAYCKCPQFSLVSNALLPH